MTKLMNEAFAAISRLPPETQDDIARFMMQLVERAPASLTPDESAAIAEAEAEIARGELVAAETIEAFWRKHGA